MPTATPKSERNFAERKRGKVLFKVLHGKIIRVHTSVCTRFVYLLQLLQYFAKSSGFYTAVVDLK